MISTEISTDVAALVDALVATSPGQTIAYSDLSTVIGRDVRAVGWLLQSARRVATRDHGALFGSRRGVGLCRLTTDQISDVGVTARTGIRRKARYAAKAMTSALSRANDVPPEVGRKVNAELSVLGLIQEISGARAAKPAAEHSNRPEPVAVIARRLFPEAAA